MDPLWASFRQRRTLTALVAVLLLAVIGLLVGAHFWYEATYFVTTDNAAIAGALVRVTSPDPGRIFQIHRDVGTVVRRGDLLAVIDLPLTANLPMGGTRSTFLDAHDRLVDVPSPVDGIVVGRTINVGDTISTSQTLLTVVDTRVLWVVANVEETQVGRVRPGQRVEVYVDALHRTVDGIVEAIIPATTATFSLLPAPNASGNFTKIVQLVPVKIALAPVDEPLIVGSSASVRIHLAPSAGR